MDISNEGHTARHTDDMSDGLKYIQIRRSESYASFTKEIDELDKQILSITSEIRKLETSAEVVGYFTELREYIIAVSKAFRYDAEEVKVIKPEETPLEELGPSQPLSLQLQAMVEYTEKAFSKLDILLNIPSGQSRNWHTEVKKRWEPLVSRFRAWDLENNEMVILYFIDLSREIGKQMQSMSKASKKYTDSEIVRAQRDETREQDTLVNLTTVSTIISAVAATALQITATVQDPDHLFTAVNAFWFFSLSFSISSVVNTLLDLFRRSYINHAQFIITPIPPWIATWIRVSPRIFLALSILTFQAGLCLLTYASHQTLVISIMMTILTALSSSVVLGVCSWFGFSVIRGRNRILEDSSSQPPLVTSPSERRSNAEAMTEVRIDKHTKAERSYGAQSPPPTVTVLQALPTLVIPGTPASEVTPSPVTGGSTTRPKRSIIREIQSLQSIPFMPNALGTSLAITRLSFSPDGNALSILNIQGEVFIYMVKRDPKYGSFSVDPLHHFASRAYTSATWFQDSQHVLLKDSQELSVFDIRQKTQLNKEPLVIVDHPVSSYTMLHNANAFLTVEKNTIYMNILLNGERAYRDQLWDTAKYSSDSQHIQDIALTMDDRYLTCAIVKDFLPIETHIVVIDIKVKQQTSNMVLARVPVLQRLQHFKISRYDTHFLVDDHEEGHHQLWKFEHSEADEGGSLNIVQAYKSGQGDHSRLDKYVSTGFLGHEDELVMAAHPATGAQIWETFSGRPVRSPFGSGVTCFSSTEANQDASILLAIGKNDGCVDIWAPKSRSTNLLSVTGPR